MPRDASLAITVPTVSTLLIAWTPVAPGAAQAKPSAPDPPSALPPAPRVSITVAVAATQVPAPSTAGMAPAAVILTGAIELGEVPLDASPAALDFLDPNLKYDSLYPLPIFQYNAMLVHQVVHVKAKGLDARYGVGPAVSQTPTGWAEAAHSVHLLQRM